jgi:hypothetical protein
MPSKRVSDAQVFASEILHHKAFRAHYQKGIKGFAVSYRNAFLEIFEAGFITYVVFQSYF